MVRCLFSNCNFTTNQITELSIAPQLNHRLVPNHIRSGLAERGLDINNFQPLAKEEMMARLD